MTLRHTAMIMHPGLKLRHIRAFLDIAAAGSLTFVARSQGITQPALSRTLAEAESLLSVSLFWREGRRLKLTEQGAVFRRYALQGLQALEAGAAALSPGSGKDMIRVGVLPTASTRLFPRVALRFRDLSPDVVLSIVAGPHPYLMQLLRDGGLDLMVGRMPAAAEMSGLSFDHLYEESVVLVARAGHPALGKPSDILPLFPLIMPPHDAIIRTAVDDYIASLGLIGVRPAFETVALAVGRGILLESDALWFISRGVVADDLDKNEMQIIPTDARFLSGSVGMTRVQALASQPGLDLLIQITKDAVRAGLHG